MAVSRGSRCSSLTKETWATSPSMSLSCPFLHNSECNLLEERTDASKAIHRSLSSVPTPFRLRKRLPRFYCLCTGFHLRPVFHSVAGESFLSCFFPTRPDDLSIPEMSSRLCFVYSHLDASGPIRSPHFAANRVNS